MTRQQISAASISPWAVVAAVLLPPLGVFLVRGITPAFWLTVFLTLIAWLPGVVVALALLLVPERIPIR
ncbi:MAG: YqaE/Pmp3 family membrane protein [Rhizorhabdus sp.]